MKQTGPSPPGSSLGSRTIMLPRRGSMPASARDSPDSMDLPSGYDINIVVKAISSG